jgi:DnaJ-class molecular chaperone
VIHAYACGTCNGTGLVNDDGDGDGDTSPYQVAVTCSDCDGTGIDT